MAKNDFTKATQQEHDFNQYQHADFDKIKDTLPTQHYRNLVEKTLDLTAGLNTIIQMLERNSQDKSCDGSHLLTAYDEGALFRLASGVSQLLYEEAERSLDLVAANNKKAAA